MPIEKYDINEKAPGGYGYWKVTTEGDCEGRTVKQLGVHYGNLADIAFALADQVEYKLQFEPVDVDAYRDTDSTHNEIEVSLDILSGTWDIDPNDHVQLFRELLENEDVRVEEGNYYASIKLVRKPPHEEEKQRIGEMLSPKEIEFIKRHM